MTRAARLVLALLLALTIGVGAAACGKTAQELGIPLYKPSDTVSQATGSTVLKTSDPVDQVEQFYGDFIEKQNWNTVSHTSSSGAANYTIKKSGNGATISIATSGTGTVVSISTYPSP